MPKDKSEDTPPVSNTKIIYRRKRDEIFGIDSNTIQMALGVGGMILGGLALLNSNKKNEDMQQLQQQQTAQSPENQPQLQPELPLTEPQIQAQQDTTQSRIVPQIPEFTTDSVRKEVIDRYKGAGTQPMFAKRMSIA